MPTRPAPSDDTVGHLVRLATAQQRTMAALLALTGSSHAPDAAYERYFGLARSLVREVARFEAESPGSFDVAGFAQPLVQQLSIHADHLQAAGRTEAARELRREADELAATHLRGTAVAAVRRDRAMQAAAEGRFHDAIIGLTDARAAFVAGGTVLDKVQTELQLANVYEWLGDHERALSTLESAYDDVAPQLAQGPPTTGQVLLGLARQLTAIARGEATREGEDALALRRIAYEVVQGRARNSRRLGDLDAAEELFAQARPFAAEHGVAEAIDFHLAVIAVARGDVATASRVLSEIAPAFDGGLMRPRRGALRQVQADLELLRGDPGQALVHVDDGLQDQSTYPDLELEWKLRWRRARALLALGSGTDAVAELRAAMSAADRARMAPLGYRLDTTFVRDKLPMAHDALDAALSAGDASAVAWFVELVKSRALAATLSLPRTAAADRTRHEAEFDSLSQQIDALAFAQYRGDSPAGALQQRLSLIARRDTVLEEIRIRDPKWRALTEPPQVDLQAIAERLGPDRDALTLHHRTDGVREHVVAALVGSRGVTAGIRELDEVTAAAVRRFAANLRQANPADFLFDLSAEEGVGLEQLLPAEVVVRLGEATTLLVAPHGLLHLLPWACLTLDGQRLFERCAVGLLPNLASLPVLDGDASDDAAVALIGDADYTGLSRYRPLQESAAEIGLVSELYDDRVVGDPVTGAAATEEGFWALADAAGAAGSDVVLHYNGHGSLETSEPLASGLVLTGSTVDAAELLMRRLPYREVVLSACSTAWRPQAVGDLELAGDDALGLPASLLEAGSRFVLASVPPVREKASRAFTLAWHRHRRSGASPLQAYRAVQQESYAAEPDHVFAWAGFAAYGCR